ncbi:Cytidine deaminase-like protein [Pleurotus pulmonarius]
MANKSQFYLSMCVEAASKSPMNFNLGSIIVKGGKVLSSGYNHQRSRYDEAYDNTLATPLSMHSEMHAIFRLTRGKAPSFKQQTMNLPLVERLRDHRLNGADLYVVRVTKVGMGTAKPCNRCVYWCRWAGIRRIYHWDQDSSAFLCIKVNDYQTENYETRADDLRRASPNRITKANVVCRCITD